VTGVVQSNVRRRLLWGISGLLLLLVAISLCSWFWVRAGDPLPSDPPPGLLPILTNPIPDGPNAALVRRGRYLAIAGDCASCHTRRGGQPFEGGLGLQTPFGVIYTPNLTGDRLTGMGKWTPDEFYRALHQGVGRKGSRLYPALPYTHFTIVSRADSDAILAFLKTVPGVRYSRPASRLLFPVNLRASLVGWDALAFTPHAFRPDPAMSRGWNRGAYLVEGLGHCGACHTPRNFLGAELESRAYQGARIDNDVAPDLTANARTGLRAWSEAEIAEYLRTGRNSHANASGPMAEVVTYSTSLMSNDDLRAIATYLKALPASPTRRSAAPEPSAMRAGSAIFSDACTACHLPGGKGQPRLIPPLPGSAVTQQQDPAAVIRLILAGGRTAPTLSRPGFPAMPSFAWKLTDQEVADVATYVRNAWGNNAPPVDARSVAALRTKLRLRGPIVKDAR
jgi:mono/diheme cytochrome c family protein